MKKNFRTVALIMAMIYVLSGIPCYGAEASSGESVLLENNFYCVETGEMRITTSGAVTRERIDEEHGTSLKLEAKSNGRAGFITKNAWEPGRYCLSFDWYIGNYDNENQFRIVGDANSEYITDSSNALPLMRWRSDKRRPLIINSNWTQMMTTYEEYEINKWYDIKVIIDTKDWEMELIIDGESLGEYPLYGDIKGVKGFMIIQEVKGTSDGGSYIDNVKLVREAEDECNYLKPIKVTIDVPEGTVGNNFYADKMPEFDITYKNRIPYKKTLDVKYNVTASDGVNVYNGTAKIEAEPYEEIKEKLRIDSEYFGVMTLDVTYTDEKGAEYSCGTRYTLSNHSCDMPNNKRVGVSVHIDKKRGEADKMVALMKNAGIGNMRGSDVAWGTIEAQKGVYAIPEDVDKLLDLLTENDIDYLYLFGGSNPLYTKLENGTVTVAATPEAYTALTKYLTELMKMAEGRIKFVEVTNEYHSSSMVPVYNTRADVHANILRAAYKGVKAGDPNVQIVGIDEDSWGMYQTGMIPKYLEEMKGEKIFDYVSLHPYPADYGAFEDGEGLKFVRDVQDSLEEHKQDRNVPMMFTELGWADYVVESDEAKAAYTVRAHAYCQAEGIAERIHNYTLVDYAHYYESQPDQATFGLCETYLDGGIDVPYLGKEVYVAMAYWNGLMAENEFVGKIDGLNNLEKDFGYLFKDRRGRDVVMLGMVNDGSENIGINLGAEKAIIADAYGNEREIHSTDGIFTVNFEKNEIVYLIGDFNELSEIKLTEPQFKISEDKIKIPINGKLDLSITAPQNFNGNINIETNGYIKEAVGGEIVQGAGVVDLYANPDETDGRMIMSVMKDGKAYYIRNLDVEYTSSGVVEMYRLENVDGDPVKWDAVLDVRNIRRDMSITGNISINPETAPRQLPVIAPGEVRRIRIPIAEPDDVRNVGKFTGIMNFSTGANCEFVQSVDTIFAPYTKNPPKVDGNPDEWSHGPATMRADTKDQMKMLMTGETWKGTDDLSMLIDMRYDLENVYVMFEITDDVFYQPYQMTEYWRGDSVQLAFGFDINSMNGTCFNVALDPDGNTYSYRTAQEDNMGGFQGAGAKGQYTDGQQAVKRIGNKTYYEMSIPWHKMSAGPVKVEKGDEFYFSAIINDNDGTGRKGYMEYASGVGSGGVRISSFYKLYLGK